MRVVIESMQYITYLQSAVPSMPTGIVVNDYDYNYITLSWLPPETPNGILELYGVTYQGFKKESLVDEVYNFFA